LLFIYTKVGKVRFKPRSGFTLWILSKDVYIFHSGFKCYAGGKKHDVNSFHELSKALHVYKNALLLHTQKKEKEEQPKLDTMTEGSRIIYVLSGKRSR